MAVFSIIMITKSGASEIANSITSLRDQDFEDWQLIVKDFGSSDQTEAIVASFNDTRITYIARLDDGIYDALNQATVLATGSIVGLLHVEDLLHQGVLTRIAEEFQRYPEADAVLAGVRFLDQQGRVTRIWVPKEQKRSSTFLGWMPPHTGMFVRRTWYTKLSFNTGLRIAGDYDWIIRFLNHRPNLRHIGNIVVDMTNNGASKVSIINQFSKMREDYSVLKTYYGVMCFVPLILKPIRKITQFRLKP